MSYIVLNPIKHPVTGKRLKAGEPFDADGLDAKAIKELQQANSISTPDAPAKR